MSLKIDKVQLDIIINNDDSRKRLRELDDEARRLQKELKKIPEGTQAWIDKSEELKRVQSQYDAVKREIGLTGMTLKELRAHQKELNLVMSHMDPNIKEYKTLKQELTGTNARIKELTGGAKTSGLSLNKMADGFNKYFGMVTAFAASLTSVIFGFRKLVDDFNAYEKKVDELSSLTGLAGDELNWLSDQAKGMSTSVVEGSVRITQSADDIIGAFTKVGSARPELLKDKEALREVSQEAIILSEAANSELQPAVDALTMVLNQFNAPASDSRRIINALAAGSKEGAGEIPYLTTAIEKSGTVAADVDMSYEQLIGTIETLAPRITQPEIAGRSLKGVILDLQKTADDTNPAVVGFSTAIENLGKKNLSTAELMKIFGSENITAAKILLNSTEETKKYTAAVTDTNVAIEQATINTDNNASKLAQAKNKTHLMALELGEKLAPAMTFSTNAFTYFLKAIIASIRFYKEHSTAINSVVAAMAGYTLAVKMATIVDYAFAAAAKIAKIATDLWKTSLKTLPMALTIGLLAGLATALSVYKSKTKEAAIEQNKLNAAQSTATKAADDEETALSNLFERIKLTNPQSKERIELVNELNEKYPDLITNVDLEKASLSELNKVYDDNLSKIRKRVELKSIEAEADSVQTELNAANTKLAKGGLNTSDLKKTLKERENLAIQLKALLSEIDKRTNELTFGDDIAGLIETKNKLLAKQALFMKGQTTEINDAGELVNVDIDALSKELDALDAKILASQKKTPVKKKKGTGDGGDGSGEGNPGNSDKVDKVKDAYEKLNEQISEYKKLELAATAEGNNDKASWYASRVRGLEKVKKGYDDVVAIMNEYPTKMKIIGDEQQKLAATDTIITDTHLDNLERQRLADEQRLQDTLIASTKEYAAKRAVFEEELSWYNSIGALNAEELAAKNKIIAAIAELDANFEKYTDVILSKAAELGAAIGSAVGDAINSGEDFMKAAGKAMLQFWLKELKNYAELQVVKATIGSLASAESIATFGVAGIAKAAILTGLIEAAYGTVSSVINQAATGKYPVIGASDGKTYNAGVMNNAKTGLLTGPTILAGEQPEIIIDTQTTRRMQMDYPGLINAIYMLSGRMPQAAGGKYPAQNSSSTAPIIQSDPALLATMMEISRKLDNPTRAKVVYTEFEDIKTKVDETRSNFGG